MITRELLDDAAAAAMADRSVDLQAVWRLGAQRRRERRRRLVGVSAAALVAAVSAAVLLAGVVPGVRLARPAPAEAPTGPGAVPARIALAPHWTPRVTDRPIGRVALVLAGSPQGVASGSEQENLAAQKRVPDAPVLVGADPAGGDQLRLLPDGDGYGSVVAVSADGAWVAWSRSLPEVRGFHRIGVLRARTGVVYEVELSGTWHRGVSVGALAFTADGAQLRIRGGDVMGHNENGPDRVWAVDLGDDGAGPLRPCDCRPDDVPWPLYEGEQEPTGLLASVEVARELRIVASASQIVAAGRLGPEVAPARWWQQTDWYRWVLGRGVEQVLGHLRWLLFALLAGAAVVGVWRARRAGLSIEAAIQQAVATAIETGVDLTRRRASGRILSGVVVVGVLVAVALAAVAGLGLGLPEPVAPRGDRYVVPSVITGPPPRIEPAFEREGEPRTTRVGLVTRGPDRRPIGLDAATGAWVSLDELPGLGGPRPYESEYDPLVVSPNGRFVLRAGADGDSSLSPSLLIDLETARTTRVELPFGTDPSRNVNESQTTAAVMDDGTVALVRHNLGALWLVPRSGRPRELTGLADVRSVSAQPGGLLLVSRPRNHEDGEQDRVDLVDVAGGRVRAAATDIGAPTVLSTVGQVAALAWQDGEAGTRQIGLPGASGKTVRDSTWYAAGGIEALWPSEQGLLIGLGWSKEARDTLLRADPGVDGTTSLRPLARIASFMVFHGDDVTVSRAPVVSVAGSVMAQAQVVAPASQPWWGRLAWRVISHF